MGRRRFCGTVLQGAVGVIGFPCWVAGKGMDMEVRWILASCMYGRMDLEIILPEVHKIGARHIDIWPAVHGNQREQIDEMGLDAFQGLLDKHQVQVGILTRYDLGPFSLDSEMKVAQALGCGMLVTGAKGPKDLVGSELKKAVREFAEKMKPRLDLAGEAGVVLGIENHAHQLICSPDSMKWLAEFSMENLGIALAPYHLPQDETLLSQLILDLGEKLFHFYAWQHGLGCHEERPKEEELLQMPGRGELDFTPLMAALQGIGYQGWIEIFMHPFPRGIPILPAVDEVTAEIHRSRRYLEDCMRKG